MSDWLSQTTCGNCLDCNCAACGGGARDVAEMCDESDKLAELMAANLELTAERDARARAEVAGDRVALERDELRAKLAESEYALNQSESTLERVRELASRWEDSAQDAPVPCMAWDLQDILDGDQGSSG